jgi:hypothetical protein
MRQVRTCDFCGADATGVYEPLPSSIPEAPRMLLCDACRDRLSSVVDPLLARLEGDLGEATGGRTGPASGSPAVEHSPGGSEAGSSVSGADAGAGDAASDADADGLDDLEAREWPTDPRERPEETADGSAAAGGSASADSEGRGTTDGPSGDPDVEHGSAEVATSGADESAPDRAEGRPGTSGTPPSSIEDPGEEVEVSESRDASGRTQRERGGAPRGYRKVLRFLENRTLPIDRGEAEQLAAEAYELEEAEVGAAIDHAVQYGRLREVSGELRR